MVFAVIGQVLLSSNVFAADAQVPCVDKVREAALRLYALHVKLDPVPTINYTDVVQRPSLTAPDGKSEYLVLETTVKPQDTPQGQHRIRMIYALSPNPGRAPDCILMGQEILDLTSL